MWPEKENGYEISEELISLSRVLDAFSKLRSGRSQESYQTQNDNKTKNNDRPGAQYRECRSSESATAIKTTNAIPSTRKRAVRTPHDGQFTPDAPLNRFYPRK